MVIVNTYENLQKNCNVVRVLKNMQWQISMTKNVASTRLEQQVWLGTISVADMIIPTVSLSKYPINAISPYMQTKATPICTIIFKFCLLRSSLFPLYIPINRPTHPIFLLQFPHMPSTDPTKTTAYLTHMPMTQNPKQTYINHMIALNIFPTNLHTIEQYSLVGDEGRITLCHSWVPLLERGLSKVYIILCFEYVVLNINVAIIFDSILYCFVRVWTRNVWLAGQVEFVSQWGYWRSLLLPFIGYLGYNFCYSFMFVSKFIDRVLLALFSVPLVAFFLSCAYFSLICSSSTLMANLSQTPNSLLLNFCSKTTKPFTAAYKKSSTSLTNKSTPTNLYPVSIFGRRIRSKIMPCLSRIA